MTVIKIKRSDLLSADSKKSSDKVKVKRSEVFVDEEYARKRLSSYSDFASKYDSYFKSAQDILSRKSDDSPRWKWDASSAALQSDRTTSNLKNEATKLLKSLENDRKFMSEEGYNTYKKFLSEVSAGDYKSVSDALKNEAAFREQVGSAENYKKLLTEAERRKEYEGYTYSQLKDKADILKSTGNKEKADWVSSFAKTVMTGEDYDAEIKAIDNKIAELESALDQYWGDTYRQRYKRTGEYTQQWYRDWANKYGSTGEISDRIRELLHERDQLQSGKAITNTKSAEDLQAMLEYGAKAGAEMYEYNQLSGNINGRNAVISMRKFIEENGNLPLNRKGNNIIGADGELTREALAAKYMDKDEYNAYVYLYGKYGKKEADEYLDGLADTLKKRQHETGISSLYEDVRDNLGNTILGSALSIPMSLLSGREYIQDVGKYLSTGEMDRNFSSEASQVMRSGVSDKVNIEIAGWDAFDFVYNTTMSGIESATVAAVPGGEILLGLSAAASATNDALDRGLSNDEAFWTGVVSGTAETFFEHFSIENLKSFKTLPEKTLKGYAKNIAKSMIVNASEETLTEVANIVYDTLANADLSSYALKVEEYINRGLSEQEAKAKAVKELGLQVLEAGASGALMGLGFGVGGSVLSEVSRRYEQNKKGEDIVGNDNVDALIGETEGVENQAVQKYTDKVKRAQERQNAAALKKATGRLFDALSDAKQKKAILNKKDLLQKRVREALEGTENADKAEKVVLKALYTGLSKKADRDLYEKVNGAKILDDIMSSEDFKAENEALSQKERAEYHRMQRLITDKSEALKRAEALNDLDYDIAADGIAKVSGKAVDIKSIETLGADTVTLSTSDGVHDASDMALPKDDAVILNGLSRMVETTGIDRDTANIIYGMWKETEGADAISFILGAEEAIRYGKINYRGALESGVNTKALPESLRESLFKEGARMATVEAEQTEAKKKKASENVAKKNGGLFAEDGVALNRDGTIDESVLTSVQKANLNGIRALAKLSPINFHIFKSRKVNGKFVATINGETVEGSPNGLYFRGTNDIWLDLNAGDFGEGTMLWTAGHEISHYIRERLPAKWKAMADYIMQEFTENDAPVDYMLEKQKAKILARESSKNMTEAEIDDAAYEELISDALTEMLTDGSVVDYLAKVKQQDRNLWQTIMDAISDLIKRWGEILGVYKGRELDVDEAKALRAIKGARETLAEMYAEAFAEANEVVLIDSASESVAPSYSERTWTESEYVQERELAAEAISEALGVGIRKAYKYIDDINSIAAIIADDRTRLDYKASLFGSSFVSNSEYGGSFDFTTLCKKRRLFTGTFTEIQKRLRNTALTPDDILKIRNMMIEKGLEATCGLCYVEGSRANMGKFAKEFIRLYERENPDGWKPDMADVNTPDGVESMRINHPEVFEQYEYFWNHYGKLKEGDPALFASQQKPKLYEARKAYKGEILENFGKEEKVNDKNKNGGIRMQSFSDFEIVHLIDTMQIIMDMSRVGLAGQAYTKVPEFARAFGDTGLKINLSLIAKGVDADGKLIFDDREGMPHETAFELRRKHSKNVGTIIVAFTDEQIYAAMADPRIDFIIPFHRSQWKKGQYGAMGLPKGTKDYTYVQNEKLIKQTYHEYRGRMVKDKAKNFMPNEYWDFSKSGKENAEAYLEMCAAQNKRPKFYKFLDYAGNGKYALKKDGSTDGYWKLLIDFKMYDNDGVGSPQNAVTPDFAMDEARAMLEEYRGGHNVYPVAREVVDEFVAEYEARGKVETKPKALRSERNKAPTLKKQSRNITEIDRDYMSAVGNGDMEAAQRFVDEAAKRAGFTVKAYHGTTADFNTFDKNKIGQGYTLFASQGFGFYFTESESVANSSYGKGKRVVGAYLKTENPFVFVDKNNQKANALLDEFGKRYGRDFDVKDYDVFVDFEKRTGAVLSRVVKDKGREFTEFLEEKGYDGITYNSYDYDNKKMHTCHIVFEPNQIKSADPVTYDDKGNVISLSERFNTENKDIRYSERKKAYSETVNRAKEYFGTTTDFAEAGFILPSGELLRLTDDDHSGERAYDHRAIGIAYGVNVDLGVNHGYNAESNKHLDDFVDKGGIRFYPGDLEFNHEAMMQLSKNTPLTKEQEQAIRDFIKWKKQQEEMYNPDDYEWSMYDGPLGLHIDFGNTSDVRIGADRSMLGIDYLSYTGGQINADRIIADIRHYYKTGETRKPSSVAQFHYSERNTSSNRSLLANALETTVANADEAARLALYKENIAKYEQKQAELDEINAKLRDLYFAKGKRDTAAIKSLQNKAKTLVNAINRYDNSLLQLESTSVLKDILARERKKAVQRQKSKSEQALANYKEAKEKKRQTEKLYKLVTETADWITKPKKGQQKVPDIIKEPYAEFLEAINLSSDRLLKGGAATQRDSRLGAKMTALADVISRIQKKQDPSAQETSSKNTAEIDLEGYLDLPAEFVVEIRGIASAIEKAIEESSSIVQDPVALMAAEDVKNISKLIRGLNHAIRNLNTLYSNKRFENARALGEETVSHLDELGKIKGTTGIGNFIKWDNALPFYAFKRFGKGGRSVFEELMDAQDKLAFLAREILDFKEKTWSDKEANAWSKDSRTVTLPSSASVVMTTADAMSIYCLSKREQARPHLIEGGVSVVGQSKLGKQAQESRAYLTEEDLAYIATKVLNDRQRAVADEIQYFMSSVCAEWGNEISMKRFLTRDFTEQFYFPIDTVPESRDTKDPTAQQTDLFRLLNISATKGLVKNANNRLVISNIFDVFTSHSSDMARLNAYGMAILDYMKWVNYRVKQTTDAGQRAEYGVRDAMKAAYGDQAFSYVFNLIKDINGRPGDNGDNKFLMGLVRGAKTASVGFNLRVAFLQPTAYPRAAMAVSPRSLAMGVLKLGTIPRSISRAKEHSGIALWKSLGFYDTNISKSIEEQIRGSSNFKQKLIEISMKGAEWGDAITWGALWNACEYDIAKTKKFKVGSAEFTEAVADKFREAVYSTQVVDSVLTRSQIMRKKSGLTQTVTAFMAEPTLSANLLMDAAMEWDSERRRGSWKSAFAKKGTYLIRAMGVYATTQILSSLIESFFDAFRDDDDEEFKKKYLQALKKNAISNIVPLNKLPLFSDAMDFLFSFFDLGYFSTDRMETTVLTYSKKAIEAWSEIIAEERGGKNTTKTYYNAVYNTVRALSYMTGVSASGALRDIVAVWNNTLGSEDSTLKFRMYEQNAAAKGEAWLRATEDGKKKQAEKIFDSFEDDDKAESGIKEALKNRYTSGEISAEDATEYLIDFAENENSEKHYKEKAKELGMTVEEVKEKELQDKAFWTLDKWDFVAEGGKSEDYSKYNDLYSAVETGKNLKKTIAYYKEHGASESTLRTQITEHFKPIYQEMTKSERAKTNIKGYLVNAFKKCGLDEYKAGKKIDEWLKE